MNKPESVVKKHFNFIKDFVDFLIQRKIQIDEYHYHGYAFGSWYLIISYKDGFRRFCFDGRDSFFVIDDDKTRKFSNMDDTKKVFNRKLSDEEKNDLLTVIKDFIE